MNPNHFTKVFDLGESGFKDWGFAASGLIFVTIGLALFFLPQLIRATRIPFVDFGSWRFKFFRYFVLGFALLWTTISFAATFGEYWRHQSHLRDGQFEVVEGPIENFVPMPYEGHGLESFSVSGVKFAYSDYVVTDAFNNSASHGGPIRGEEFVRISYDPADNAILRLEVRDFKASTSHDTGPRSGLVPPRVKGHTVRKRDEPPWYASLFVYLGFLDYVGLLILYRPYLRTFFSLRTKAAAAPINPQRLIHDGTMKLRDTLIRADRDKYTIWLRPRGFNVFQVPLLVGMLRVDAQMSSVTSFTIRFSSLFPVTMIAFFGGAYVLFSQAMPANVPAAAFVGFAAVLFVTVGTFRLREILRRMEVLIERALPELKNSP